MNSIESFHMKTDELIALAERKAFECELTYHGCSPCVLIAIQEVFNLENDRVFKASSGLGVGIGRMHSVCGELLVGAMALGMKHGKGKNELENTDKLFSSMEYVEKLYRRFEKEFESVMCREIRKELLGEYIDKKIPEEYDRAVTLTVHKI